MMEKKTVYLVSIICFLAGIVMGFFIAPMKQGIGNNCGNNYYYKEKEETDSEDNK